MDAQGNSLNRQEKIGRGSAAEKSFGLAKE